MPKVVVDGVEYIPVSKESSKSLKENTQEVFFAPKFTKENLLEMLPVVVSDLKHHSDTKRQILNQANLARDLYAHVIRNLYDDSAFKSNEKDNSQVGMFIKGYVRDVWDYLQNAYDLIHSTDLVKTFYTECSKED